MFFNIINSCSIPIHTLRLCLEGPTSIFRGLNQKDKEIIAENHTLVHFKKGTPVIQGRERNRMDLFVLHQER